MLQGSAFVQMFTCTHPIRPCVLIYPMGGGGGGCGVYVSCRVKMQMQSPRDTLDEG